MQLDTQVARMIARPEVLSANPAGLTGGRISRDAQEIQIRILAGLILLSIPKEGRDRVLLQWDTGDYVEAVGSFQGMRYRSALTQFVDMPPPGNSPTFPVYVRNADLPGRALLVGVEYPYTDAVDLAYRGRRIAVVKEEELTEGSHRTLKILHITEETFTGRSWKLDIARRAIEMTLAHLA